MIQAGKPYGMAYQAHIWSEMTVQARPHIIIRTVLLGEPPVEDTPDTEYRVICDTCGNASPWGLLEHLPLMSPEAEDSFQGLGFITHDEGDRYLSWPEQAGAKPGELHSCSPCWLARPKKGVPWEERLLDDRYGEEEVTQVGMDIPMAQTQMCLGCNVNPATTSGPVPLCAACASLSEKKSRGVEFQPDPKSSPKDD